MTSIRVTHDSSARPELCWRLLADFAHIDVFNPHLKSSYLLPGSPNSGVGTVRQCNMKIGGHYIRERVTDWQEGLSYTVDIYESTFPLTDNRTTIGAEPQPGGGTKLFMQTTYRPKYGMIGWIMNRLFLRRTMGRMLRKVLVGLAEKAEAL